MKNDGFILCFSPTSMGAMKMKKNTDLDKKRGDYG